MTPGALISGAQLTLTKNIPGDLAVTIQVTGYLPASTSIVVANLEAEVPCGAETDYRSTQQIQIGDVELQNLSGTFIGGQGSYAYQVVGYLGDTTGDGAITSADLTAENAAIGDPSIGFPAYNGSPWPARAATSTTSITSCPSADAQLLSERIGGVQTPMIPAIPPTSACGSSSSSSSSGSGRSLGREQLQQLQQLRREQLGCDYRRNGLDELEQFGRQPLRRIWDRRVRRPYGVTASPRAWIGGAPSTAPQCTRERAPERWRNVPRAPRFKLWFPGMGSSPRFRALGALAIVALVLCDFAGSAHAAKPRKKKPAHPPAAGAVSQTAGRSTLLLPAPAAPAAAAPDAPAASAAPTAPEPASAPEAAEPDAKPETDAKPTASHAEGPLRFGRKHTLVIDDLSGFRASSIGGVSYSGPLGFSAQSFSENVPAPNGSNGGTDTFHFTTFWFAPSADYFLFDHLSIGLVFQVAVTSANYDQSVFGSAASNHALPTTTDITFLPRVGWMVPLGDRWGIWPRIGLGYASRGAASVAAAAGGGATSNGDTYSAFILDLDVGVLYRMNPTWFLRAGPELTFGPGSHSVQSGNTTVSLGASLVSFSLAGGFGFMWNL